jgi:GDP-L-fucose synthase
MNEATMEASMHPRARIYVAGGATQIGRVLLEHMQAAGFGNVVGAPPEEPDLTDPIQVEGFFAEARPEYVIVAAGRSGGIRANQLFPADLMLDNRITSAHVIHYAARHDVKKLLYLASACAYPKHAPQPLRPESLLTGPLEPSSEPYALAKLAGNTLCRAYRRQHGAPFICAIPANPFGPHDDFGPDTGHVIPAVMCRMYEAKQRGEGSIPVWGTGTPRRDFLYVRDLADACLFALEHYDEPAPINLGTGCEQSIVEVARQIADVVGYRGELRFDPTQPDGMPRKALDCEVLRALGWRPRTDFRTALAETYAWFLETQKHSPRRAA